MLKRGQTLGRYELLVPVAKGGMALVWAARLKGTRKFQKVVAVKTMLQGLSEEPQFEEMFLAEAELASRIHHPHVCEILDLGEQDGTLYIVMEWVDGESLSMIRKAAYKKRVPLPLPFVTRIGLNTAAGLHAAHEMRNDAGEPMGLVHRDVTPQNILVTFDGVAKLVDFGVAKATSFAGTGETQAGQLKGKVPYMSPEQAAGAFVDRRTDVFALGIVLYELISGRHPFRGENDLVTLRNIVEGPPVTPLVNVYRECPPSLSHVVATALQRDPNLRFQTMADFARALDKVQVELTGVGWDHDIGYVVRQVVGDRGEQRQRAIKEAIQQMDAQALPDLFDDWAGVEIADAPTGGGGKSGFSVSNTNFKVVGFDPRASQPDLGMHSSSTHDPQVTDITALVKPKRQHWKAALGVGGAVAVLALGGAIALRTGDPADDSQGAGTSADSTQANATANDAVDPVSDATAAPEASAAAGDAEGAGGAAADDEADDAEAGNAEDVVAAAAAKKKVKTTSKKRVVKKRPPKPQPTGRPKILDPGF